MRTYTLSDIRALNPCYDPSAHLPDDWSGTVADGLRLESIPASDRIWVAVRLIDPKIARLFAVWCAREALTFVSNPDPRSIAACDVAERHAYGQATDDELRAAEKSAWAAAEKSAWAAAGEAAGEAAWAAAWAAAGEAVRAAAWAVARESQVNRLIEMLEEDSISPIGESVGNCDTA
jgi:hypothetical protein